MGTHNMYFMQNLSRHAHFSAKYPSLSGALEMSGPGINMDMNNSPGAILQVNEVNAELFPR